MVVCVTEILTTSWSQICSIGGRSEIAKVAIRYMVMRGADRPLTEPLEIPSYLKDFLLSDFIHVKQFAGR